MIEKDGRFIEKLPKNFTASKKYESAVIPNEDKNLLNILFFSSKFLFYSFQHNKQPFPPRKEAQSSTPDQFYLQARQGGQAHHQYYKDVKDIDEFVFRYNTRTVNDLERFGILLSNMTNRLRYKDLIKFDYNILLL